MKLEDISIGDVVVVTLERGEMDNRRPDFLVGEHLLLVIGFRDSEHPVQVLPFDESFRQHCFERLGMVFCGVKRDAIDRVVFSIADALG